MSWFEDADIDTFGSGTPINHATWLQMVNSHGRAAFKARSKGITPDGQFDPNATYPWRWLGDQAGPTGKWQGVTSSSPSNLWFPLGVLEGQRITEMYVIVSISTASAGGVIRLIKRNKADALAGNNWSTVVNIQASNPWNIGSPTEYSLTGQIIDIEAHTDYDILISGGTDVSNYNMFVWYVGFKAQFGIAPP